MLRAARTPTHQPSETERRPVGASAERAAPLPAPSHGHALAHVPVTRAPVGGAPVAQLTKKDPRKRAQSEAFFAKKNAKLERRAELERQRAEREAAAQEVTRGKMRPMLTRELGHAAALHRERVRANAEAQGDAISALKGDARPNKPESLTKDGLTAHHLLPYNFIREKFADSLKTQDTTGVSRFMAFAGRQNFDSSEAYRLMAPQRAHRPSAAWKKHQAAARAEQKKRETETPALKGELPTIVQDASERSSTGDMQNFFRNLTWSPHNIFMGPKPSLRLDDPHEGLDARYHDDGNLSESSKLARRLHESGMESLSPTEISNRVKRGGAEATKSTRAYDPNHWTQEGGMVRQKGSLIHERRREKWTKKNNWQKLQQLGYIEGPEAEAMKHEAAAARGAKRALRQRR